MPIPAASTHIVKKLIFISFCVWFIFPRLYRKKFVNKLFQVVTPSLLPRAPNLLLMRVLQRSLDINHGQQHEHECLDERYQNAHHHHRQRDQERSKPEEDHQYKLVTVHVTEETKGKGDDAAEVADDLDKEHHRCQPENRTH